MTNIQIDFLSMFCETKSTCCFLQPAWNTNMVFTSSLNTFDAKISLIKENRDAQLTPTQWTILNKERKKTAIEEKKLLLINHHQLNENAASDNEIPSKVFITTSDLKWLHRANLIGNCNMIVTKASENNWGLFNHVDPQKNTTFTFTRQPNVSVTEVKKSTEKGNLREHKFEEGIFNITNENTGYDTQQQTVFIVKNENSKSNIKLEII